MSAAELPVRAHGHCRFCGAPIFWARTERRKMMPIDAAPNPAGNVVLDGDPENPDERPLARVVGLLEELLAGEDTKLWMPHHATCPGAVTR